MTGHDHVQQPARSRGQNAAAGVAVVFLLAGLLGFVPGITTNVDSITFAGHQSDAMLFGVFQVSILHNLVHLLFGVAGLIMARTRGSALAFLMVGGAIYLALWLYGLIIDQDSAANFVPVNNADNWLHFALGLAMILLGIVFGRNRAAAVPAPPGGSEQA